MLDGFGVSQPRILSPKLLRDVRVLDGKAFNVRFINYRLVRRGARMPIVAPIKIRIGHHRFRHEGSAVFVIGRTIGIVEEMGEDRLVPSHLAFDGPRIRIEQEFGRITAMSFFRLPWPVDAKAVALAGAKIGQIAVPAKTGYLW